MTRFRKDFRRTLSASLTAALGMAAAHANVSDAGRDVAASAVDKVPVIIERQGISGRTIRLNAELALSFREQLRGLSQRETISTDTAMLFPQRPPRQVEFWMKDTPVALDMLFVTPNGRIDRIVANAPPNSLNRITNGAPVAGVIELAGGRAAALGIAEGDKARWGICPQDRALGPSSATRTTPVTFCPLP